MEIFKGKYYKKLYEKEYRERLALTKSYKKATKFYEVTKEEFDRNILEKISYINSLEKLVEKQNNQLKDNAKLIVQLKNKLIKKEKNRRETAGKVGGLTAKNNRLLREKQDMLDLINRLLVELRKLSKEKHKPTLNELREYFKIKY